MSSDPARDAAGQRARLPAASASQADAPAVVREVISASGRPLGAEQREHWQPVVGVDLGGVRVHDDAAAHAASRRLQAKAWAFGTHIGFADGRFDPDSAEGLQLLGHELVHVAQQSQPGAASRATVQRDPDEDVGDPIATWPRATGSVLMVFADDRLIILPAAPLVHVADAESQRLIAASSAHMTTDLGALMEVPPVGAGGTRVFRAGRRAALVIDAGSDPAARIPAAVYLNEFQGTMASLGVRDVSEIRCIHVHQDHISEIPTLIASSNVTAERVSIPGAYLGATGPMQRVVAALRTTTDPSMVARGFGTSAWTPANPVDPGAAAGDVLRFGYTLGELRVEAVALRSALRTTARTPDLASFMTKVTRTADRASIVVLGDLRGRDLSTIRDAMEAQRSGSWNEFFSGVTTLSGFSHHAGRLETGDIAGLMLLFDATLLRGGSLRVVEQTTTSRFGRARTDTLELLETLGIPVAVAELPSVASTSGAGATRSTLYSRGPSASVRSAATSPLADALARVERLRTARATIETWRPWLEESGGAASRSAIETLMPELHRSEETLRQAVRTAAEAALRVRAGGAVAAGGGRDYAVSGGALGTAFQAAVAAIPAATPAETSIGAEGFARLQSLREMPADEIPMRVALHAALYRGEYSDRAFAHMLAALEPDTRTRLLTGRRGGPSPRLVAFERVRAEYRFRQEVLGSGDTYSMPRSWSSGRRLGAGGVVWLQLALELWNGIVQPLLEAHETATRTFRGRNLVPFIRRFMFWNAAGVQPRVAGAIEHTFAAAEEVHGFEATMNRLSAEQLAAFWFESPVLEDVDVMRFGVWLSYNVRNYDEFATLFIDSGQDAIRWEAAGSEGWASAIWRVRAGVYETEGDNHVEESWYTHPTLTRLMQTYVRRLIGNTATLLDEWRTSSTLSPEREGELGHLDMGGTDRPLYETTLSDPTAVQTALRLQPLGSIGAVHASRPAMIDRTARWWTPPRFFVYRVDGSWAEVSGADYNTYANLRSLSNERHTAVIAAGTIGADSVQETGNETGRVWIRADQLAPRPATSPTGAALIGPSPSGLTIPAIVPGAPTSGSSPTTIRPGPRIEMGPIDLPHADELGPAAPGGGVTVRF